jgi:hypothetical protein
VRRYTYLELFQHHDFTSPTINDTVSLRAELVKEGVMTSPKETEEDEQD